MKPPLNFTVKVLRNYRLLPISFAKRFFAPESNILGKARVILSKELPKNLKNSIDPAKKISDIAGFSSENFSLKFNISNKYLPNNLFIFFIKECKKIFDVVMEIRHKDAKTRYFTFPGIFLQLKEKIFPKKSEFKTEILTEFIDKIDKQADNSVNFKKDTEIIFNQETANAISTNENFIGNLSVKEPNKKTKNFLFKVTNFLREKWHNFINFIKFQTEKTTVNLDKSENPKDSLISTRDYAQKNRSKNEKNFNIHE